MHVSVDRGPGAQQADLRTHEDLQRLGGAAVAAADRKYARAGLHGRLRRGSARRQLEICERGEP